MACGVVLLHVEPRSDSIITVLVQFHQSSFFINMSIERESGSDSPNLEWQTRVLQCPQYIDGLTAAI